MYKASLHFPSHDTHTAEPYLALSYCWGGDQEYKTTKERINSGDSQLDWSRIPKSIQDALVVTASLGYKYLWVDSLCIVQDDDKNEVAKQIGMMSEIYTNATLTIMASKAESATEGFLGDMAPSAELLPGAQPLAQLRFWDRKSGEESTVYAWDTGSLDIQQMDPIDTRGWTFQEYYLSTRVLEYRSKQVKWFCRCCVGRRAAEFARDERFTDGWFYHRSNDDRISLTTNAELLEGSHMHATQCVIENECSEPGEIDKLLWRFYYLVEVYSGRQLSLSQDRILAISGIAELLRSRLGEEYAAGLWKRTLPLALLWQRNHALCKPRPRPGDYQGPSWSWTAVNGGIYFHFKRMEDMWSVTVSVSNLQVSIDLVEDSAPCGAVRFGQITGLGRIRKAVWSMPALPHQSDSTLRILPEANEDIPDHWLEMVADAMEEEPGSSADSSSEDVYLLEIGYDTDIFAPGPYGLVLRALDVQCGELSDTADKAPRTAWRFSRVGMFRPPEDYAAPTPHISDTHKGIFERCEPQRFEII